MNKPSKTTPFILLAGVLFVIVLLFPWNILPFLAMQEEGRQQAGTWEDDPKNWERAFQVKTPAGVKAVHSRYWRSDHFTDEFIYYFEVEATAEWKEKFIAKHNLRPIPPETARSFRENNSSPNIPVWFAPDPVGRYDVWDKAGYYGSVWIDKPNGHIFFYGLQL